MIPTACRDWCRCDGRILPASYSKLSWGLTGAALPNGGEVEASLRTRLEECLRYTLWTKRVTIRCAISDKERAEERLQA